MQEEIREQAKPLVSVVVPIYNVAGFIDKGLGNLLGQSYACFEIWLIDDGSTDGSGKQCDDWAKKCDRIRVLHKPNEGAGSARNRGLDAAQGKYVYFFDIDDEADPRLLSYCVGKMEALQTDMMVFGFETVDVEHGRAHDKVAFREHVVEGNSELRACYVDELLLVRNGNGFPWNKFYRKDFLDRHGLRYEDQRIQQDEVFNLKVYPHVERLYLSPEILYTYFIYGKGNTRSRFIPQRMDIYIDVREHFEALKAHWRLDDAGMEHYLQKRFWDSLVGGVVPNMFHPDCPWTALRRKQEFEQVLANRYTQDCLAYMDGRPKDVETRLYHRAFCRRSLLPEFWIRNRSEN